MANRVFAQSDAMGALPTVHAATSPDVVAGGFYGPGGPFEVRGFPVPVNPNGRARDVDAARQLWARSEELTGVRFDVLDAAVDT